MPSAQSQQQTRSVLEVDGRRSWRSMISNVDEGGCDSLDSILVLFVDGREFGSGWGVTSEGVADEGEGDDEYGGHGFGELDVGLKTNEKAREPEISRGLLLLLGTKDR